MFPDDIACFFASFLVSNYAITPLFERILKEWTGYRGCNCWMVHYSEPIDLCDVMTPHMPISVLLVLVGTVSGP
jgi:hypothetical protein